MAGVYKGLTIELNAKTTALDAALKRVETEAKGIQREMRAMKRELESGGGGPAAYARQMKLLENAAENAAEKAERLRAALENPSNSNMTPEQFTRINAELEQAERNVEAYRAQMGKLAIEQGAANSALGKAGAAVTSIGERLEPVGQKMQSIGGAMTMGVTMPIIAGASASVKAAVDIDTALTDVKKTVDGTAEDYAALKEAAVEFSKTNAVGAAEMLSIESLGAQLGYTLDLMSDGKSEVQEFGEVVSGLDIATNMTAEQAGTELAQFFNIMNENKENTSNFGSAIVGLGNSFATTEGDISAMAMRIAGAGKSIGLSSADVLGLSTALTSLGIEAEAGGTAISTVMSGIDAQVAVATEHTAQWADQAGVSMTEFVQTMRAGGPAADAMADAVGVSASDIIEYMDSGADAVADWAAAAGMSGAEFAAAWKDKPVEAFEAVLKGMQDATEEGSNLTLQLDKLGISSIRQTDMMKRLANSGDLMSRAVAQANKDWQENVALTNEVANRNDSMAAKFEMLKNRIIAVAEEIGAPIADAMFEAVEAAEPLFEAIENGARAFSEMSEGEQRAVVQTVAIIAALGPALSVFGKVASNVTVLGKAMTSVSQAFTTAQLAMGRVPASLAATSDAAAVASAKTTALSAALSLAKGAAVGLAAVALVALAAGIKSCVDEAARFENATSGLAGAVDSLGESSGFDSFSKGAIDYAKNLHEATQAQSDLADELRKSFSSTNMDSAKLEYYSSKIQELGGNVDGDARKLAELKAAVSGYNSIAGTSIQVIDEQSGALNASTGEIERNTAAWKANALAQAAQDAAAKVASQMIENEVALERATKEREAAEKSLANASAEEAAQAKAQYDAKVEQERKMQALYDESVEQYEELIDKAEEYSREAEKQALDAGKFRDALAAAGASADDFDAAAGSVGKTVDELADALKGAGIDAGEFARLGTENFKRLYTEANGDLSLICKAIDTMNATGIDPKHLEVSDDGTIRVNMDELTELDLQELRDKGYIVTDNNTIQPMRQEVQGLSGDIDNVPSEKSVKFEGDASGLKGVIESVKSKLSELPHSWAVNFQGQGRASGGVSSDGIRRNASGGINGIVTRATLTNVGWVGEDGAEAVFHMRHAGGAIVPLTNRRYVRPFAQAVASEMCGVSGGRSVNVTVNLDYKAGDDANKMARDISRRITAYMNMEA